jgi:hypothetical protein
MSGGQIVPPITTKSWSLDWELMRLAAEPSLQQAVARLGLSRPNEVFVDVRQACAWARGGAETYILPFSVRFRSGAELRLMMKAVVAFSNAQSLEGILEEWLRRRALLRAHGVAFPQLFFAGQGVLVESYIDFELTSFLRNGTSEAESLLRQVFEYAGILSRLKFAPVDAFSDLRTDGNVAFVVDVGSDLGPPGSASFGTRDLFEEALNWAEGCIDSPSRLNIQTLRHAFHSSLTETHYEH